MEAFVHACTLHAPNNACKKSWCYLQLHLTTLQYALISIKKIEGAIFY